MLYGRHRCKHRRLVVTGVVAAFTGRLVVSGNVGGCRVAAGDHRCDSIHVDVTVVVVSLPGELGDAVVVARRAGLCRRKSRCRSRCCQTTQIGGRKPRRLTLVVVLAFGRPRLR